MRGLNTIFYMQFELLAVEFLKQRERNGVGHWLKLQWGLTNLQLKERVRKLLRRILLLVVVILVFFFILVNCEELLG